jgi:hypothetical protein
MNWKPKTKFCYSRLKFVGYQRELSRRRAGREEAALFLEYGEKELLEALKNVRFSSVWHIFQIYLKV